MTDEEVLSFRVDHAFNKVHKHLACWDLSQRGSVGETPLHVCLINDTEAHLAVAKIMLSLYPKLSLDYYEGEEYYGKKLRNIIRYSHYSLPLDCSQPDTNTCIIEHVIFDAGKPVSGVNMPAVKNPQFLH